MRKMNHEKLLPKLETAVFGGGCFWFLDPLFSEVKGVQDVMVGYAGGMVENPTYEEVSSGATGHAEVVKVTFDPSMVSYENLLRILFSVHDPTTLNRQGNDVGTQYRSIILYTDEYQREIAERTKREIEEEDIYEGRVVTEIKLLENFYPAEKYHQKYFQKNPDKAYCQLIISPKLAKFRAKFSDFRK